MRAVTRAHVGETFASMLDLGAILLLMVAVVSVGVASVSALSVLVQIAGHGLPFSLYLFSALLLALAASLCVVFACCWRLRIPSQRRV